MKVADIMKTDLCSVDPEATIGEAATLMGARHIGSVVVLDGAKLVGILTERDIVRAMSNTGDAPQRPVIEWMSKDPKSVGPDTGVREALRTMVDAGFRHLPICEGETLVGMVSIRDVASSIADD